jgi:hypothetical protein
VLGLLVIFFGGRACVRRGALEFGGGKLGSHLSRLRPPFAFFAITPSSARPTARLPTQVLR